MCPLTILFAGFLAGPPDPLCPPPEPGFRLLWQAKAYDKYIRSIDFSPDGSVLATAGDFTIILWDARTGKKLRQTRLEGDLVSYAHFGAAGHNLICSAGSDEQILLLDPGSLKPRVTVDLSGKQGYNVLLPPDRTVFAVTLQGGAVRFFDAATGKARGEVRPRRGPYVDSVALTPDGRELAVLVGEHEFAFWDITTGKQVRRWRLPVPPDSPRVGGVVFLRERKVLAMSMVWRDLIQLWDLDRGEMLRELRWGPDRSRVRSPEERRTLPPAGLRDLTLSPDGKTLAAACCDGKVRLWEMATGGLRHEAVIQASMLAFSPDGRVLATARLEHGTVRLWDWRDPRLKRPAGLTAKAVERLWADLSGEDASAAYRAIAALAADPGPAVKWLDGHLHRVEPVGSRDRAKMVAALGDEDYEARQRAFERLARLGRAAEGELQAALARRPSAEQRKRATALLRLLERVGPERRRVLRSVEVLESVGTRDAKRVLERLASGAAGAVETEDARGALKRLAVRTSVRP